MTNFDSFHIGCRWGNRKLWLQIGKRSSCYLWIKRHCKLSGLTNKSVGLSMSPLLWSDSLKFSNRTVVTLWKLWIKLESDFDKFSEEFRRWGRFSKWCFYFTLEHFLGSNTYEIHWERHLAITCLKTQQSHWNVNGCTKNWMIINLILKLWNRKILNSAFWYFFRI